MTTVKECKEFLIGKNSRGYILIRKNYPYEYHSHFNSISGCDKLLALYKKKIMPTNPYFIEAMQRITTDKEFDKLKVKKKKDNYRNNYRCLMRA